MKVWLAHANFCIGRAKVVTSEREAQARARAHSVGLAEEPRAPITFACDHEFYARTLPSQRRIGPTALPLHCIASELQQPRRPPRSCAASVQRRRRSSKYNFLLLLLLSDAKVVRRPQVGTGEQISGPESDSRQACYECGGGGGGTRGADGGIVSERASACPRASN